MESLYILIPFSLALILVIVGIFYWSIKSGQLDDLEGPGHSILMDDDVSAHQSTENKKAVNLKSVQKLTCKD